MSKELGIKLTELRAKAGFTQSHIAKHLSVDRSTYSNYERAITEPEIKTLKKLAAIFSVDLNYLLSDTKSEQTVEDIKGIPSYDLKKHEKLMLIRFRLLSDEQKSDTLNYMEKFLITDEETKTERKNSKKEK